MKISTAHFVVPADLQPYLDSFWFMESDGSPNEISPFQYCLANGSAEMIIHVAPPFTHFGYADQSHFIRDFKTFTGENPTSFMSGFAPQNRTPFAISIAA